MSDLIQELRWWYDSEPDPRIKRSIDALEAAQQENEQLQSDLAGFAVANTEQADQLEQAQAEIADNREKYERQLENINGFVDKQQAEIERLTAENEAWQNQNLLEQCNKLSADNERLRDVLNELYSAENYEQLSEMLDDALKEQPTDLSEPAKPIDSDGNER